MPQQTRTAITLERDGPPPEVELTLGASADPYAGTDAENGKPIWNPDQIADHLNRTGFIWSDKALADGTITYGFYSGPTTTGIYNNPHFASERYGYEPMSAAQQQATRESLAYWDDLIDVSFVEKSNGHGNWDMAFATTTTGPGQAWAYLPHDKNYGGQYKHIEGDVWINPVPVSGVQLVDNFYGMQTLTHEIGHALGLSHPGDYDAGDNVPLSYELADYFQDSRQYSVMSYWEAYETGAMHIDWNLMRFSYATTPLVHDIYAIQQMYGADETTRTGDSTYGFNWSQDLADRTAFQINNPDQLAPVFTIYDAGGTDTLDLSGYATPSYIDLNEGAFSSAGGTLEFLSLAEINANNAAAGLPARTPFLYEVYNNGVPGTNGGLSWKEISGAENGLMHDNISIAYGTVVENAKGGSGADTIVGNEANNVLTGNGGADRFTFLADAGNDTIADFGGGDRIDLSAIAGIDDMSDLSIANTAGGAVVTYSEGVIKLTGVNAASLTEAQFVLN